MGRRRRTGVLPPAADPAAVTRDRAGFGGHPDSVRTSAQQSLPALPRRVKQDVAIFPKKEGTNYRVTEGAEKKNTERLLCVLFLCALCDSVVRSSLTRSAIGVGAGDDGGRVFVRQRAARE